MLSSQAEFNLILYHVQLKTKAGECLHIKQFNHRSVYTLMVANKFPFLLNVCREILFFLGTYFVLYMAKIEGHGEKSLVMR